MRPADVQDQVIQALVSIAPELASSTLKPDVPLRDQVDLDSMDFLRFVVELHQRSGVEVPEADYGRLATLADIVAYLSARVSSGAA